MFFLHNWYCEFSFETNLFLPISLGGLGLIPSDVHVMIHHSLMKEQPVFLDLSFYLVTLYEVKTFSNPQNKVSLKLILPESGYSWNLEDKYTQVYTWHYSLV